MILSLVYLISDSAYIYHKMVSTSIENAIGYIILYCPEKRQPSLCLPLIS
jgi:hypothetical protein